MLTANELRLGNLIYDTKGQVNTVTLEALKYIQNESHHQCKPIELSEQWLLRHTEYKLYKTELLTYFDQDVKTKCNYYRLYDDSEDGHCEFEIMFVLDPETDAIRNVQFLVYGHCINGANIEKYSVHLLQNSFYIVTSEELTIKP